MARSDSRVLALFRKRDLEQRVFFRDVLACHASGVVTPGLEG